MAKKSLKKEKVNEAVSDNQSTQQRLPSTLSKKEVLRKRMNKEVMRSLSNQTKRTKLGKDFTSRLCDASNSGASCKERDSVERLCDQTVNESLNFECDGSWTMNDLETMEPRDSGRDIPIIENRDQNFLGFGEDAQHKLPSQFQFSNGDKASNIPNEQRKDGIDSKYMEEMYKHLEKQSDVLMESYRVMSNELHRLQVEEEMMMRKFYEITTAERLTKKV
ncbi:hypothetical protein Scep_019578 [Stephania cephalantha]|uniref:Uncharacterized protein n=1 Tax=Stephania cephalantha TaxID=152367 RepID=A0AAP0NN22_9MAGN